MTTATATTTAARTPEGWDAEAAFDRAIAEGRLSADPRSPVYAGRFMFMGPAVTGRPAFKNIATRQYLD